MNIARSLVLIMCTFIIAEASSHDGAMGVVKERMDAMSDMSDKSKLVANMFKGKVEFDQITLADAANAFVEHGTKMTTLFPSCLLYTSDAADE